MAFVTENGPPAASSSAHDVDGGPTALGSPEFDLDGHDAVIAYDRWFFTALGTPDQLIVEITNDLVNWVLVESLHVRHVVVGSNFVFGQGRSGNLALLQQLGDLSVAGADASPN